MEKVWKATSASDALRGWLDDSGMGNDPRAIIALSAMSDLQLSKAEAQSELTKLMDPKSDYWSKDDWRRKPAVARVQLLTRIAERETRSEVTDPRSRAKNAEATKAAESAKKNETAIRAELTALAAKKTMTVDDRKRWIDLVARIS